MDLKKSKAKELSYISKCSGQTEELVQAGGGNTSVKLDGRYMLIKASGFQLTEVTEDSGFSVVDCKKIAEAFALETSPDDSKEQEILSASLAEGKKPSIETFLHSVTDAYTIHTHPLGVNILTALSGGMDALKELFPEAAFVDYATPGIKLAKKYYEEMKRRKANTVFLKNHGLIVSADSADKALRLQDETVIKVNSCLKRDSLPYVRNMKLFYALNKLDSSLTAYRAASPAVLEAVKRSGGEWSFRFSPDCIVYLGKKFFTVSDKDSLDKELEKFCAGYGIPKVIIFGDSVFIAAPTVRKAKEIESLLDFTAEIYLHSPDGKWDCLPEKEADFLLNWDSEKYRRNIQ